MNRQEVWGLVSELRDRIIEHDKLLSRGEAQVRQLKAELQVHGTGIAKSENGLQTPFPEMDEQVVKEIHHMTVTAANQEDKVEKMQKDAVGDAKAINEYLNQLH